ASFAALFTSAFGADGAKDADDDGAADADAISYALGISAAGADSGLVDTLTGEPVTLTISGNVVTGASATGGTVFTITVNAETGEVTLDQLRAVEHDDPSDASEDGAGEPSVLAATANLITLTATITDGDGDSDSATIDITGAFAFEDAGP